MAISKQSLSVSKSATSQFYRNYRATDRHRVTVVALRRRRARLSVCVSSESRLLLLCSRITTNTDESLSFYLSPSCCQCVCVYVCVCVNNTTSSHPSYTITPLPAVSSSLCLCACLSPSLFIPFNSIARRTKNSVKGNKDPPTGSTKAPCKGRTDMEQWNDGVFYVVEDSAVETKQLHA